ncbi:MULTISPECIES: FecR domain-containing protein [unclassified Butyricimonas]|uniref:FecR domain-containing protein n=1 Tax=unclassified Butyricimonas TaxID=2637652 RepID=UPI000C06CD52|nr:MULTISPECIES: FecR domain-containing protein [unclassified Butyricimonas]
MNERIEELLVKRIDGELSAAEEKELSGWLAESEAHGRILREFEAVRQRLSVLREEFHPNVQGRLQSVKKHKKRRVRYVAGWMRYVAVGILLVSVGSYLLWNDGKKKEEEHRIFAKVAVPGKEQAYIVWANGVQVAIDETMKDTLLTGDGGAVVRVDSNRVLRYEGGNNDEGLERRVHKLVIPNGGEYRMVLEDGSVVWLNSASSLEIPERFAAGERRVRLVGEAYFKVKKDSSRPFYVATERADVCVLGTEFNVSAYEEDRDAVMTLVNGAVRVDARGGESVVLEPGQQALTAGGKIEVQDVDVSYVTSWVNGKFSFDNSRLEDIARQVSRWYDVKISFDDDDLKDIRFSGAMLKFRPLSDLIEMIEATSFVRFSVKGENIIISGK